MIERLQNEIVIHRKMAVITCPETCMCRDIEACLAALLLKEQIIEALKAANEMFMEDKAELRAKIIFKDKTIGELEKINKQGYEEITSLRQRIRGLEEEKGEPLHNWYKEPFGGKGE